MRRLSWILFMLFPIAGFAARPEMTVQTADVRDANGMFTNWATLTVTWDETPLTTVPDPKAWTTKGAQTWAIPDGTGLYWKLSFKRTKLGEYAIRVCFDGVPTADTIWSEAASIVILRPGTPRAW